MANQRRLLIARNAFLFIIFVCFGVIIVTEKSSGLLLPKIEKKMQEYLDSNYNDIQEGIKKSKVSYDNPVYKMKITSIDNKNHFFYILYSDRKISDTYKEDYVEGKQLFTKIQKDLENGIRNKISTSVKVEIISTLDKYTSKVQDRIIREDNLLELKFYSIEKELTIKDWNSKEITSSIIDFIKKCSSNKITPKSYKLVVTNSSDITESIEISNITEDFITNENNEKIITDILSDNTSKILRDSKIQYKYLN